MREPFGRAALGDHRIGDEPCHRRVAHAFDERADHVNAAGHGFGPLPLGEERDHRLHREVPGASSELLEDGVQLLRVGAADVVDEPPHDVEERRRLKLDALRALGGGFLQPLHQLFELGRVLNDVDDRADRRIVDGQRRPGHRGLDNRVDRGGEPLLFAQDLGVVDFADFETRTAAGCPEPGDAAIRADFFGAAREQ